MPNYCAFGAVPNYCAFGAVPNYCAFGAVPNYCAFGTRRSTTAARTAAPAISTNPIAAVMWTPDSKAVRAATVSASDNGAGRQPLHQPHQQAFQWTYRPLAWIHRPE